jgi:tyrosine-protein phosphatase YwqE
MFFNFKKFENPIKIDIHSHLLPNIDDGVKTINSSLEILRGFEKLGYTKVITTPHIMSDSYPNTKEIIEEKLALMRRELKKANINIELDAGAEHYVDMEFLNMLSQDRVVPFCGKFLLFETSYMSKPIILEEAIFEISSKGYIPVMAHPERYLYLHDNFDDYIELKRLGVLFQVNVKSLKHTHNHIYKMAMKLIKHGMVDFLGSDTHRMRDLEDLAKLIESKDYKNIFKNNRILNTQEEAEFLTSMH